MPAATQTALRPVFIDSPSGRLFALHVARMTSRPRGAFLYIPPFAEEMNRSRRMAALEADALAALGFDILLLDLFGTGDSAGDFADARIARWLDDIGAAAAWLESEAKASVSLWGLRFGALLASLAAGREPRRFERLLFWQPVIDGKQMLTQFLRIRVAASMADGGPQEKTDDLRAQLAAGTSVEVAGYEVAPDLARGLDELRLDRIALDSAMPIDWLDLGAEANDQLGPAGARVIEVWRKNGHRLSAVTVAGDPFWTLQETTLAPGLIAATTRLFNAER
jgi:exosortase A-associated hydrolase 2